MSLGCSDSKEDCYKLLGQCQSNRELIQGYVEENCQQSCGFCYPDESACIDLPSDPVTQESWRDVNGLPCSSYSSLGFCEEGKPTGRSPQPLDIFENDGLDALEACCVCGGGRPALCPNDYQPVCVGHAGYIQRYRVGLPSECFAHLDELSSITDNEIDPGRCKDDEPYYELIIGQSCDAFPTCKPIKTEDMCRDAASVLKRSLNVASNVNSAPGCTIDAAEGFSNLVWNPSTDFMPATAIFPVICKCGDPCPCDWNGFLNRCCDAWVYVAVAGVLLALLAFFITICCCCWKTLRPPRPVKHVPLQNYEERDYESQPESWGPNPVGKKQNGYPSPIDLNRCCTRGYCGLCFSCCCCCCTSQGPCRPNLEFECLVPDDCVELYVCDRGIRYPLKVSWDHTAFDVIQLICQRSPFPRDPKSLLLFDFRLNYLRPETSVKLFGCNRFVHVQPRQPCICCGIICARFYGSSWRRFKTSAPDLIQPSAVEFKKDSSPSNQRPRGQGYNMERFHKVVQR